MLDGVNTMSPCTTRTSETFGVGVQTRADNVLSFTPTDVTLAHALVARQEVS